MALDLVQFLPDLLRRHERIVEMALLEFVMFRDEGLVVGEGFDYLGKDVRMEWSFMVTMGMGRGMKDGTYYYRPDRRGRDV